MIQKYFCHVDKHCSFNHTERKSLMLTSAHFTLFPSSPCTVISQVSTSSTCRSSPWEIYITLHPATAEDQDSQYVCFTLVLQVPTQVRPLWQQQEEGRGLGVEGFSSNMLFSPSSIPMRCHRFLSVTPEDSQMNRSTSESG